MVKKVTLDTLEIEEPEIPLPERTTPAGEETNKIAAKRPAAKWLWISALALVVLMIAGGVAYWRIGGGKTVVPRLPNQGALTAAPLPAGPATAQVNDFIITSTDNTGEYLVTVCDLTLELSAGQDALLRQNMLEVREIIYELLKKTRAASLREAGFRRGLKEEIRKSLGDLLGPDAITAVYFTKFVVL